MGEVMHDSEVIKEGEQVFTACGFIWEEFEGVKKVFLPRRAETKKFLPGVYELPGGHVDFGEEMKVGLAREIKEEFEIDIEVGDPFFVFTYDNAIKKSHSIEVVYFARFVGDIRKISLHPEDHAEYGWFSLEEYVRDVLPVNDKGIEDQEEKAIRKGFGLLEGEGVVTLA